MANTQPQQPPKPTVLQRMADAATRALGRWRNPWFDPKYINSHMQDSSSKNPAVNTVGPAAERNVDATTARSNLIREKLWTTFQGGALRFLPMDDGITDETPEMRSEYMRMFLKEPAVKSAMQSKIISVVSSKMSIEPASEDEMDKEASKWMMNILTSQKGGIRKMGENILLFAVCQGHSLNEKIYHVEKKKQFAHLFPHGYIGLKQLKIKKPEDYQLEVDQFRNVRGVWSNRAARRFDPSYFVITSHMPMYENPAGTSDLRAAIRAYNLIGIAQQLRAIWAEQFSMPYMEGTYPPDNADAKTFVEAAIQQLRALGWYVKPQGVEIRAIEATTKGQADYQEMIDDLRKEIYLCIVGSYLQAIEGDTQGGAGNSETHRSTFELFQWYLCELLADTINDQIVPDLMGMNFSGLESPKVSFAGVNAGDLLQSIAIRQAIKTLGIDQSKKAIRKEFEVDPPLDDEDKLQAEQAQQPGMGGQPGFGLGLDGLNQQDKPPIGSDGAAPKPLEALKMSDGGEKFQNGAKAIWQAMHYFDRGVLTDVALAKEMAAGPDGLTDFGTMMRTAKYHGVSFKEVETPSIFDLESDINDTTHLAMTTMTLHEGEAPSFVFVTTAKLKNDQISVLTPFEGVVQMTPEEFLDRWPGEGAKRRVVIFYVEQQKQPKEGETPADPAKHSEDDDDEEGGDGDKVPGSGVGPRNPVNIDDIPAGPDGQDIYKLLNDSAKEGSDIVSKMAKKAASRMLNSGDFSTFFNEDELETMAESLESCMAPADLLGRASVLIRLERAKEAYEKSGVEKFSEQPAGLARTFAEARLRPMKPSAALKYFQGLVPSMKLKEEKWLDTLKRKTFTLAEATNKRIVERVKKVMDARIARGDNVTGPQAIEDVLTRAGIHPSNPQYPHMVWRTNYMDMLNTAAEEQRTDPDVIDDFPVWKYKGIKDGRQSAEHEEHFDNYYPAKVSFDTIRGERKFNCRCMSVPVYKAEWQRLKAKGKKVSKYSEGDDPLVTFSEGKSETKHDAKGRFTGSGSADETVVDEKTAEGVKRFLAYKPSENKAKKTDRVTSGFDEFAEGRMEPKEGLEPPAMALSEKIMGGNADGQPDEAFDPEALMKGIKVELEHTSDEVTAKEIAKDHLMEDPKYYDKLATIEKHDEETEVDKPEEHDYCSTQFELPHAVGLKVLGMGERIRDEDLHEKGREDDPHITLLFGIHDPADVSKFAGILAGHPAISGTLRRSSVFSNHEEYDVVKLNVDSPELHRLREKVAAACPHTETHPYYQPHVTLAYVKKGLGQKYANMLDLEGTKVNLSSLMFCDKSEGKTQFKFGENLARFDEIYHGPNPPSKTGWQEIQKGPRGGRRWRKVEGKAKGKEPAKEKKSASPSGSGKLSPKAPGSQLEAKQRDELRKKGMVGTFPPADVPVSNIKIHEGTAEELKFKPLMQWDQKTKSGRISRQYRYTQEFHDRNAATKFDRVMKVEPHLEKTKKALDKIITSESESWERRDAAAIAAIIAETGLRPTDGADSVKHGHFGIASLQSRHVTIVGNEARLNFIGKEGVRNKTVVRNPVVVKHLKATLESSSHDKEPLWLVGSSMASQVLKETVKNVGGPDDVMLKDLRTIKATQEAKKVVEAFKGPPPPLTGDKKKDTKMVVSAILSMSEMVAKVLNNTASQARDNYIHPEIFKSWQSRVEQSSKSSRAKV